MGITMEYAKLPFRAATGPTAQRAYLMTFFLILTSLALLGIAALGYPVFYYSYVPKKVVSVPVHLQYNAAINPYGLASIAENLMVETAYDVSVELTLPRSPDNIHRGNFMVALFAMKSSPADSSLWWIPIAGENPYDMVTRENVVFASRRATLVPYTDPLVSLSSRLLFLPYHIFVPQAEKEVLHIRMGELVEFKNGLPLSLLLDVQAGQTLQVYSARVELMARLSGIRWAMYNHRILSFLVCTTLFWFAELMSMGFVWLLLQILLGGQPKPATGEQKQIAPAQAGGPPGGGGTAGPVVKRESETKGGEAEGGEPEMKHEEAKVKEESVEDDMHGGMPAVESPTPRTPDAGDASISFGGSTATDYSQDTGTRRRPSQQSIW